MKKLLLASLSLLLLSACGSQTSETPSIRVVVSPAAQPVSDALANCAPINNDLALSIEMRYPNVVNLEDYDLFFRLGEPSQESGFAAQIAWEQIGLIVNSSNDLTISREAATSLFSGRVQNWSELGGNDEPVALWVGPESDEARQAFESNVLLGSPASGSARVTTNPANALQAVANDPGAIAILPTAWVDQTVRQIDLGLQVPVIVMSPEEPTGFARDLLACLQSPAGQELLAKNYRPFQP